MNKRAFNILTTLATYDDKFDPKEPRNRMIKRKYRKTKRITRYAERVAEHLGWDLELPVRTDGLNFPERAVVDVGNSKERVAIEIDGKEHNSLLRALTDLRKTNALERAGWTVIRIKNEDVEKWIADNVDSAGSFEASAD